MLDGGVRCTCDYLLKLFQGGLGEWQMDKGKGRGKSQIHWPILPSILGLTLFWPALSAALSRKLQGTQGWNFCVLRARIWSSSLSRLSFPLRGLRTLLFLMLEESGETGQGQGSLLTLLPVIPQIIRDLVPKLKKGEELNPEAGGGCVRNAGRRTERCD